MSVFACGALCGRLPGACVASPGAADTCDGAQTAEICATWT